MSWVRVRGVPCHEIHEWCNEHGVTFSGHNEFRNQETFKIDSDWFIADEKELILFKLRWSNTE